MEDRKKVKKKKRRGEEGRRKKRRKSRYDDTNPIASACVLVECPVKRWSLQTGPE